MVSLSEVDELTTIMERNGFTKREIPLQYNPENLVYSNLVNELVKDDSVSLEEKIAIKSKEIIDLFRSLRTKSENLNKEITTYRSRIDTLKNKLDSANKATYNLANLVEEIMDTTTNYQSKIHEIVQKQIDTIQIKLDNLLKESEKVNDSIGKINTLVFTGVNESLKPEERERIATGKLCPICVTNIINRVLDCGHVLCDTCVSKIDRSCHMCRRKFTKIIPLFIDSVPPAEHEVVGYEPPHPTVQVSPWIENDDLSASVRLIGVNTVGGRSW